MERDPMEMALSIEIIMDIVLSHLKVRDLLTCRLVSKFWFKTSSSVIRKCPTMIKNISDEGDLMELEACMKQSWDFPFTGLKFDQPWKLDSAGATEFFQNYGARFTQLCLDIWWEESLHELAPFISHLPCLSILEVGQPANCPPVQLRLSMAGHEVDNLRLPSVRTLRISSGYPEIDEDILCEVLTAASPSLQIECLHGTPAVLSLIKSCGKLGAVSVIQFEKDSGLRFGMDQYLPTQSLMLTKLDFSAEGRSSLDWLMKVLNSSQHTLKELHLEGRYIFKCSWSELPVLTKLNTLSLLADIDFHYGYLFDGCDGHQFPALKELKLNVMLPPRKMSE